MTETKITPQPEYDALYAFDAENNIEPASVIAERIAAKYEFNETHSLVDDIHYAIEDAMELGQRRGRLIPPRIPDAAQAVWKPIATAPRGAKIVVARKGGQRDDGSTYWYEALGHFALTDGHFHKSYGELYGAPELWAAYPLNPEHCSLSSTMQLCPDWRTCKCKDGCAHSSTEGKSHG